MRLLVPPPVQGLIAAGLMWGIARFVPTMSVVFPGQTVAALVLAVVGFAIEAAAIVAFARARTTISPIDPGKTRALVVSGIYRLSRNPMYLGLLIVLCGWAIWLGEGLNLLILVGFVVTMTALQIKPEEHILGQRFGDRYEAYCRQVRRWI